MGYLSENETEIHMTNRDFTYTTAKLHELFLTQDYRNDLISTFGVSRWSDIDGGQRTYWVLNWYLPSSRYLRLNWEA